MVAARHAVIVVGLGAGDESKGSTVDYLARTLPDVHTVVRYNGGPQAAHNVVTSGGQQHCFAQFGSGTFVPGVRTYLTGDMIVSPPALLNEAAHLTDLGITDALARLVIAGHALVITPYHRAMNRFREQMRGDARHGSCGMGVGETVSDALRAPDQVIRARDLGDAATLHRKLTRVREEKWEEARGLAPDDDSRAEIRPLFADDDLPNAWIANCGMVAHATTIADATDAELAILHRAGTVLFEGAQGVLLDEWHGFHPYTTWSTTTTRNADALLARHHYDGRVMRLGLLRAYATRHGPGPFVTEDATLAPVVPEPHNAWGAWQRDFRVGHFDAVAGRYALAVTAPIDGLAISHLDRVAAMPAWRCAHRYNETNDAALFDDSEIRPGVGNDLVRQERLTQTLLRCTPAYEIHSTAADHVCRAIEDHLGLPVLLRSFGPTANEKTSRLIPSLKR